MSTLKARGSAPTPQPPETPGTVRVPTDRLDVKSLALLNLRFRRKVNAVRVPHVSLPPVRPAESTEASGF